VLHVHPEAKPLKVGGRGYNSKCNAAQVAPRTWNFTCTPPSDDKITLSLEHIVQFQNSELNSDSAPKILNIDVPNYKIRQVIRPQVLKEEDAKNSTLTVNIQLLKPSIETTREEQIPVSEEDRSPPQPPNVNIKYPELDRKEPETSTVNDDKDFDNLSERIGTS